MNKQSSFTALMQYINFKEFSIINSKKVSLENYIKKVSFLQPGFCYYKYIISGFVQENLKYLSKKMFLF